VAEAVNTSLEVEKLVVTEQTDMKVYGTKKILRKFNWLAFLCEHRYEFFWPELFLL
jgi:hypothetical protein